ncbi:TonB-dependent receptor domain-containing protein [Tenacibaculum sp. nBUS_03]|uniref:TonB-dependent receptor domain-containing protein n=1 Tax=Tenacibaculum sp. nBUS_03 TaxID=3395320 RepID=UPI003EBF8EE4
MKQKIIKQRLLTVFLVLFINLISAQDKMGIITGKVTTSDNIPAEFINVFLQGTSYGTITTKDGSFTLKKVLEGEYTIQFSLIGLETKLQKINVTSGKITNLNTITLSENQTKLDEIVINAQRLNQFAQKKTDYVTRLPLKNINTPQSYSIVSNELIKEQINIDLPSSLKSITGGGYIEANTGAVSVYARGFRGDARVKNGLLMYPRARTVIENQNIERIEVIKGPSAVNYGSGFYGGLINLVSKQPLTENKLDVSYIFGSFNLHRVTADFNKSVGKNNEYRFRVNGAFHKENEFQDNGSEIRKNFFIAPSFTYEPSEKLSVTINSEFLSSTRNLNFARGIGNNVTAKTWDDIKWDFNNTYTNQDVAGEMDYALVQLNANYKFTKNWASKTAISYTEFHAEGPYIRLNAISDTQIQREFLQFLPEKGGATNIRQDFVGNYTFSNIKNKTLIGVSYYSGFWNYTQKLPNGRGWFIPIDVIDVSLNEQVPAITMNQLNAITNYRTTSVESGNNTFAGYINNTLTINEKITFLAGLRYDDFTNDATITDTIEGTDSYSQGKLSYNFGLSINPFNDQVSIYGNYMNGFNNAGTRKKRKRRHSKLQPRRS